MAQGFTSKLALLGKVLQVVNFQTGAVATGTTIIPADDTIPQNNEGDQYMSLAITPTNANNILKIDVVCFVVSNLYDENIITCALFQDTTAAALAAGNVHSEYYRQACICFTYWMIAGTTSPTTFKVRMGPSAASTIVFNGIYTKTRLMGGVMASSITITEHSPQSLIGSLTYGRVVQVVSTQTGAVATGTTTLPLDDTIPQITEGDQYMTLEITPTNANNKLLIEVVYFGANASNPNFVVALFQDAIANALAAQIAYPGATNGSPVCVSFKHYMIAGTTSPTTFRVRAGSNGAGTTTFNGWDGNRKLGGILASSITITELAP